MILRPEKIYLDEPIELYGIKVGLTYEGLKYMIDHWQQILKIATPQQLDDKARQHCLKVIENYLLHVELYERQKNNA